LVVSYLGRPVGKAFTTTAGHPGLAGLIHAGDTPSRYIPNSVSSSSLDYGSIAVARWLSLHFVPSCLDLVSCPT
jgi:hypothetical protein